MNDFDYKNKSTKYKNKYINLKYILDNKFYFMHIPSSFSSLTNILKTGYIKPNKDIDNKYKHFSGYENKNEIFMSIYFDTIKNIKHVASSYVLILNPHLIFTHKMNAYQNWRGSFLTSINKNNYVNALEIVKDFVAHPEGKIPKIVIDAGGYRTHEITTKKDISIQSIMGIICIGCSDSQLKKLQNLIKKLDLNIKITLTTETKPFDYYKELL